MIATVENSNALPWFAQLKQIGQVLSRRLQVKIEDRYFFTFLSKNVGKVS